LLIHFYFWLKIVQKFLTKQKSEGNYREEHGELAKLKELTLIYVKIIDKLFLTKAFTDVQNSQMAKLRNSVYDKSQNSKLDASYNVNMNSNGNFLIDIQAKSYILKYFRFLPLFTK